jgi:hypothetical protein
VDWKEKIARWCGASMVDFAPMQDAAGTLSSPLEPAWGLVAWGGSPRIAISTWSAPPQPGVVARFCMRARDAIAARLRPLIEKAGVVELGRLVMSMERLQRSMMTHVRSSYDRADLDALVLDPDVSKHHEDFLRAAREFFQKRSRFLGKPRASNLFPQQALTDPAVLFRVTQAMETLDEVGELLRAASLIGSDLNRSLEASAEDPAPNPCWWAYDSSIPVALAERLLAGRRSAFLPTLVRISWRTWTPANMHRAILDWTDDVSDFAGLFASIPGVRMDTVPEERKLDLRALLSQHHDALEGRTAHFEQSLVALRSN